MKKIKCLVSTLLAATTLFTISAGAATINGDESIKNTPEFKKEQKLAVEKQVKLEQLVKDKKGTFTDPKGSVVDKTKATTDTSIMSLASSGTYPTRYGVILVTTDGFSSGIGTGHAGIVWTSTTTVESFPSGGVQTKPNDWNTRYNTVYGVTTTGTTASQDNDASNWCYGKVGLPYNFNFWNPGSRTAFYCSQLVWASFKDLYGINTDDDGGIVWPVDLVNTQNTTIIYTK